MIRKRQTDNQTVLLGIGGLMLLAIVGSVVFVYLALNQVHPATRYPGTTLVSSRNDYQGLPRYLLLNQTYVTSDSLDSIYQWYTTRFHLAMVAHEVGKNECYVLYRSTTHLALQQDIGVLLCATSAGQTIQVTRSILFK